MAKKKQAKKAAAAAPAADDESKENNQETAFSTPVPVREPRMKKGNADAKESGYTCKKPNDEDVLLGRGRPIQNHPGNQHMLTLVHQYRVEYDTISRADKFRIVEDIMGSISAKGGRFMEHVEDEEKDIDYWKEVSRQASYNKVTHAFRSIRRSNLPPEQNNPRSKSGSKKGKKNQSDTVSIPVGGMPPMMHNGMMGYGAAGFPPMMNPADMGYMPWGAAMPMEMQQAMWAQQQQSMMGGGPSSSKPSKEAPAAAPASGKGEKSSVYEV